MATRWVDAIDGTDTTRTRHAKEKKIIALVNEESFSLGKSWSQIELYTVVERVEENSFTEKKVKNMNEMA